MGYCECLDMWKKGVVMILKTILMEKRVLVWERINKERGKSRENARYK